MWQNKLKIIRLKTNGVNKTKLTLLLISLIFFVNPLMAEGQEGLVIILDGMLFIFIFGLSIAITALSLKAMSQKRSRGTQLTIWILVLSGSLFLWSMLKTDPYPFEGPIDSLFHRGALDNPVNHTPIKKVISDSTIEIITNASDTSENGVYVWLNQNKKFVRKLEAGQKTKRQHDSLTLSIVRRWHKKK